MNPALRNRKSASRVAHKIAVKSLVGDVDDGTTAVQRLFTEYTYVST